MSQIEELKQELATAIKYNLSKREIKHLEQLIENEKSKQEPPKKWGRNPFAK